MVILTIINGFVVRDVLQGKFSLSTYNNTPSSSVMILSIMGLITLFFVLYTWSIIHKEIISPYILLFVTMYLYCYGQSICWILGIADFYKDLVLRETQLFIVQSQSYTLMFLCIFHLGALIVTRINDNKKVLDSRRIELNNNALYKTGLLFLIISMPAFLINLFTSIKLVISYGYGGIYHNRIDYPKIIDIFLYAGKYFEPSLICIFISKYKEKKIRKIVTIMLCLNMLTYLYIGGRSGIVVIALCILCIWHYLIKPINIKIGSIIAISGYIFAGILNAVAVIRSQSGRTLYTVIETFLESGTNILGDFIGEIGWSLTSIGYTMKFVPYNEPFRQGSTYLYGLSTIIPNLGFWDIHPATANAQLSTWLQNMLGISFGPGYTIVAETYINFGWYGILFALIEGMIIGWILSKVNKNNAHFKLPSMAFVIIFILVGLQPLVRSSFVVAFRDFIYILGGIFLSYIVILNNCRKEDKNTELCIYLKE